MQVGSSSLQISVLHDMFACLDWQLKKVLELILSLQASGSGSTFLRFLFDVVVGAVMLRMWRCGFAVFVAIVWRACCWWVLHAHAYGGYWSCLSCPSCCRPFCSLLSSVFLFCFSLSLPPSLSLSASASGKPHHLTERIWGGHLIESELVAGSPCERHHETLGCML